MTRLLSLIDRIFSFLGRATLYELREAGQIGRMFLEVLKSPFLGRIRWNLIGQQLVRVGFGSQFVVIVTGVFTGAVFAAQCYFTFSQLGVDTAVGGVVSIAMCRELGPVLAALLVTGRVGAAMTAEIGTMKVTEQIDALRSLGVHPIDYLVYPRFIGMIISIPLLIAEAIGFGLFASYLVTVKGFGVPGPWYWNQVTLNTHLDDIGVGMIKAFVFGIIIVLVACHKGMTVRSGAVDVGNHTTNSVVMGSLGILIANFFLTVLLNIFVPVMGE
ncbi:MAG: ABC transporter permease [Verrucomicrobiota bacterium]